MAKTRSRSKGRKSSTGKASPKKPAAGKASPKTGTPTIKQSPGSKPSPNQRKKRTAVKGTKRVIPHPEPKAKAKNGKGASKRRKTKPPATNLGPELQEALKTPRKNGGPSAYEVEESAADDEGEETERKSDSEDEGDDDSNSDEAEGDENPQETQLAMLIKLQAMQMTANAAAALNVRQKEAKKLTMETSGLKFMEALIDTQPSQTDGDDYRNPVLLIKKIVPSHDGRLHRDIDAATTGSATVARETWTRFVGTAVTDWSGARTVRLALKDFGSPDRMPKSIRQSASFETHLGYCVKMCAAINTIATITGADLNNDDKSSMVDLLINRWPIEILRTLDVPHHAESLATLTDLGTKYRQLRPAFKEDVDEAWREHTATHKGRGAQSGRHSGVVGVATDGRDSRRSTRGSSRSASPDSKDKGNTKRARKGRDQRNSGRRESPDRRRRSRSRSPRHRDNDRRRSRSRSPRRTRNRRSSPPRYADNGHPCQRPACQNSNAPAHTGSKCPLSICYNCKETGHKMIFNCTKPKSKTTRRF